MNLKLLPCEYFPSLAWFQQYLTPNHAIQLEQHEYFVRASMRNRCYIAGSNGVIALTIPLAGGRNQKSIMKDVKVSFDSNWRQLHWKTIESCYRRSPYFEYYADEVRLYYTQAFDYLIDWNIASVELFMKLMNTNSPTYSLSNEYVKPNELHEMADFRMQWNAHNFQQCDSKITYWQTFEDKIGFQQNLSILDGLFCDGKPLLAKLVGV